MSILDDIEREPYRFDFFSVLRMLEREATELPRIGDNAVLSTEIIRLSQDPYFEFPASNFASFTRNGGGWQATVRFLGQFGPQGALPLSLTEEAFGWLLKRDVAFPRFVDIVSSRFLQLFFRAWADARPIAQHERPDADRFGDYVGAHIGIASRHLRNLDSVADEHKRAFAGLIGAKAKSASRLRSYLSGLFGVKVEVEEFVGSYLKLERGDQSRLGARQSTLGTDLFVGAAVFSVQDRIRVRIYAESLGQYLDFLPSGRRSKELVDAVYFYVGDELEWDVELALPIKDVIPTSLTSSPRRNGEEKSADAAKAATRQSPGLGMLGWTTWVSPNWAETESYRCDARFNLAEIDRASRQSQHVSAD